MTVSTRVLRAGLVLAALLVVSLGVVAPPERCPTVTPTELRRSAQSAVDWFDRNQRTDGSWLYMYDAEDDTAPREYNEVRHVGAVMGLYQAAAADLPGALSAADRGTRWALARLTQRGDLAAVTAEGETATGAAALLVAGLTIRRDATADPRYDDVMRRLGRFIAGQVEPSGAVLAYYNPRRGAPVPGEYSKYYTGEAYWALARLHLTFPGEAWGEAADRVGHYLATARDEAEDHWPPISDHWAAYGLSETVTFPERGGPPLTGAELKYTRRQAELWGGQARWVQQRFGPWGAAVRGPEVFRGGWYGVIDEGFTGLWRTARADRRLADLQAPIAERATCIAGLAVNEQADAADAARARRPERVEGAWFFHGGETRMDDQQHALAALLRTIPIVEATGSVSDDQAPSMWLWAAALLLALNPARAAFGIPRAGRSSRDIARVAMVGGAIGGLAVCVAAAVGHALLEAVDVSAPGYRTAAGVVAVLAGAVDLFRRPPSPDPALPGWRAALVPVAIPVVARPALLVMALGAGADDRVLVSVLTMAVAVTLMTGLAVRGSPDDVGGRVLHWASRLLAAGLMACGILLAIDGVLDV
jgi:small neutral amino acid transporter SnatA (MarC family)